MLTIMLVPLCLHIQNIPMPIVNYLKTNINSQVNILNEKDVSWEKTNNCNSIIDKYFYKININKYKNNDKEYYGEIFKIFGYPASLIIINNNLKQVDEFIINKNLILMFDAGPLMRWTFYKKFKKIDIKKSENKITFLHI